MSTVGATGVKVVATSKHTVSTFEQRAYAQWLNELFETDQDVSQHLPIKNDGSDLYEKIGDGIILW